MSKIKKSLDKVFQLYRQAGINNTLDVIKDVTCLLYLKSLEDYEVVTNSGFLYEGSVLEEHAKYKWSYLLTLDNNELFDIYQNEIVSFIEVLPNLHVNRIFYNIEKTKLKPEAFFLVFSEINKIFLLNLDGNKVNKSNIIIYDDIYETLLSYLQESTRTIDLATPKHISRLMCELLQLKHWDKVYDTTMGVGNLLIAAYHTMVVADAPAYRIVKDADGFGCCPPNNDTLTTSFFRKNLVLEGKVDNEMFTWLCLMNFYFHRINLNQSQFRSFLSFNDFSIDKYDRVLSVCPTKNSVSNLYEEMGKLKFGGVCAMIVPMSLLYKGGKMLKQRKRLVADYSVKAVIALPKYEFVPIVKVNTAIVLFENKTASISDTIWFCDLYNDGYSNDKRRIKTQSMPLPNLVDAYLNHSEMHNDSFCCQNIPLSDVLDNECSLLVAEYVDSADDKEMDLDPKKLLKEMLVLQDKLGKGIGDLINFLEL